jgi:glycosyltransferase involved in cell wall biosynthesis
MGVIGNGSSGSTAPKWAATESIPHSMAKRTASDALPTRDPRLTIGMPLYNNGRTISRALDSLLAQSFGNFRLVISDDGSTDSTCDICDTYAARDSRVTVFRQPVNLNYGNFRYVLQQAETPLFMFAAGDDYWHVDYVARMIDMLDRRALAVCAVSQVEFVKDGIVVARARGTRPLEGDIPTNVARFLAAGDDNSRMYGVFRTPAAQRAFPRRDFFGYDWAFTVGTLLEGTHVEVPEVLMWRDYTEPARYIHYVQRDAGRALGRLFPMLSLTADMLFRLRIPVTYAVARQLLRLNLTFSKQYLRAFHPSIAKLLGESPQRPE